MVAMVDRLVKAGLVDARALDHRSARQARRADRRRQSAVRQGAKPKRPRCARNCWPTSIRKNCWSATELLEGLQGIIDAAAMTRPLNRPMITLSIMLATIMQTLDSTIANVALPHMQGTLSASQDQIAWVLTAYIVAAAIATPLTGWMVRSLRSEERLPGVDQRLHRGLRAVRHVELPGGNRRRAPAAGRVRRSARCRCRRWS